jgi:glyoxylase-like metal-dependent hydrolase (beta-lactamase superfamily II)
MNFDERPPHFESTQLRIDKLVVGPIDNNVYIVRDKATGAAVLVDAANEHELIIPIALRTGVRQVLTTHGHWDHIGAVTAARDAGIDVGIGAADADMLPGYDFIIGDGDVIEVGSLRLQAIHTPGHTPGSVCFLIEDHPIVLTGDTLFPGGPGKTTTPHDFATILGSVDQRLFRLPAETQVLCGHGLDTTISAERPRLEEWAARGW